jgi:hypothetical protein
VSTLIEGTTLDGCHHFFWYPCYLHYAPQRSAQVDVINCCNEAQLPASPNKHALSTKDHTLNN